jgi:putative oxidoreductase
VGEALQRLFSTFASGWSGTGLFLQRVAVAITLIRFCVIDVAGSPLSASMIPHIIGGGAAMFFVVGLWTPFVGTLIAVSESWVIVTHSGDPWISALLATIGGTLAMLGPGAMSIDARLYGRKRLEM